MTARLEHANITVSDPQATAGWMKQIFGWDVRWQGDAMMGGHTIHVGTDAQYIALYSPGDTAKRGTADYSQVAALNHLAVVVDDLDATEEAVKSLGFKTGNHADYEPGRRFYFHDADRIEFEVVQYD
ncbi:VOC family protein [Sulfitobacter sp. S190]|uniref:VOC family protein n=1 Tax=Sulfitobacter sp. S190 TaxID=2867022 RepID=UPI0021A41E89|nr:VOC family protein [Sulfitobacter sp. S190]UWR24088.1 VOC family protein [Sulfitobacter sp. S190]